MLIEAFAVCDDPQPIVPAPQGREWYDVSGDRHFYRCLPIAIANRYGYQIVLDGAVTAAWNGRRGLGDLVVECEKPHQATSNFAHGIVTFDVGYVFKTPPGVHLMVTGPLNEAKEGVVPITGVVNTVRPARGVGNAYTFTMNWKMVRPGVVAWKKGEPYCQIIPVVPQVVAEAELVVRDLGDDPRLKGEHLAHRYMRDVQRRKIAQGDPEVVKKPWERHFFRGVYASTGQPYEPEVGHFNKLVVGDPVDLRKKKP